MPKKSAAKTPNPESKVPKKKKSLSRRGMKRGEISPKRRFLTSLEMTHISLKTKLLFLLGIILVTIPIFFYINEGIQLAFFTPKITKVTKHVFPSPTQIAIPAVGIDLPVVDTALSGSTWQVADDAISHLEISANPGGSGPIILYGHNTNDRFGPIRWLSTGQEIRITTKDKKIHTYVITKTEDVDPAHTEALVKVSGETLILYTCDGFADLQRFLVFAKPEKSS